MALMVPLLFASDGGTAEGASILYIVIDDADSENMERYMPQTQALVKDQGADFSNFYVAQPVCCPSRSSALLGEYPHNHLVESNLPPEGGWQRFRAEGHESETIAVDMQQRGYTTALFGKYLNGYYNTHVVPQGWDMWFGKWKQVFYDWDATNTAGNVEHFGTSQQAYGDRVVMNRARDWSVSQTEPFFAYVAPTAPHSPYVDPPGEQVIPADFVESPSFNEADVSDKPSYIRDLPSLNSQAVAGVESRHAKRARMTEYLDTKIAQTIAALDTAGTLGNTYIVVTSDNGWTEGEHRKPEGKAVPYEESSHVPLWIRGPGIAPGTTVDELASNIDLFATFGDMAGGAEDLRDGISLLPLAQGTGTTKRDGILVESKASEFGSYDAIVTTSFGRRLKYVEYHNGERELYDLEEDPYELTNLADVPTNALPEAALKNRLDALASCSGSTCRVAEENQMLLSSS